MESEYQQTYWMDHFKFIGHPTTLTAYDEGRYHNPNNTPSGYRTKNNHSRVDRVVQSNQPIVVACQAFSEHFQHQQRQLGTRRTTNQNTYTHIDPRTRQPRLHHQTGARTT
jgi:hypothetical protein